MRPRVLWGLVFAVISLASVGAGAFLAWRAGYKFGQSMQSQAAPGESTLDGLVLLQLHAQITDPSGLSRSHNCEFSAVIGNQTPYQLLAARISLGSKTLDLPALAAGKSADLFLWNVSIPQEHRSCAERAHWLQQVAQQAKTMTCTMDGADERHCKRLVRVFADFDYTRLQADDLDASSTEQAVIGSLRSSNLAVGTTVAIPSDSFFKLGFDPKDVQKSEDAKALAAAEQPFDPNRGADIERLDDSAKFATMGGPITVLEVHLDRDQVVDWYKVSIWAEPDGGQRFTVVAWVPREDLDKARAKYLAAQSRNQPH